MDGLILIYLIIASIVSPIALIEFYELNFKETPYIFVDLTFYEFVALAIIGICLGWLIFPLVVIRGIIEVIRGIKNAD